MTVLPVDLAKHALKPDLGLAVEILSIATANPPNKVSQSDALIGAAAIYPQFAAVSDFFPIPASTFATRASRTNGTSSPIHGRNVPRFSRSTHWISSNTSRSRHRASRFVTPVRSTLSLRIQSPVSRFRVSMRLLMNRLDFSPNVERASDFRYRLRRRRCRARTRGALCSRSTGTERPVHHRRSLQPLCAS